MKPRADKKTATFALAFLEICTFTSAAVKAEGEVCTWGTYQLDLPLILFH
jgi:hypothetical protein